MPLTDTKIRNSKPKAAPYKIGDGEGMYLFVHPAGNKYWRLKYRFGGKEKVLALGVYPETSLAEAREKRLEARKALAGGNDPSLLKKEFKRLAVLNSENSFEAIAREWHENKSHGWTAKHAKNVLALINPAR